MATFQPTNNSGPQVASGFTGYAQPTNAPTSAPATAAPQSTTPSGVSADTVSGYQNLLRNGTLSGDQVRQSIASILHSQYYGGQVNENTDANYQKALSDALASVSSGIGDATYQGQVYNYDSNLNAIKKSTTLVQSTTNGAGTTSNTSAINYTPQPTTPTTTSGTPTQPGTQPGTPPSTTPQAPGASPANGSPLPQQQTTNNAPGGAGTAAQPNVYSGPSVVDYLNSTGQASDFASRTALAKSLGISGYTGTATQNTQMLSALRAKAGGGTPGSASTAVAAASNPSSSGTSTSPVDITKSTDVNGIARSLGYVPPDPNQSPANTLTNLFTQGLQSLGLTDLHTHINDLIKQQNDLENQKADEASTINSNPWLTEGERVNRLSKLDDKYSTKLDILAKNQGLAENDYKLGLDQVQWQVGQIMNEVDKTQAQNANLYTQAIDIAQKNAQFSQSEADKQQQYGLDVAKFKLDQNNSAVDNKVKLAQVAKIYSDMKAADLSSAADWAKNIQAGTAKLSDVPANLKNAVASNLANGSPEGANGLLVTTQNSLQELQNMVDKNQGFTAAVGLPGLFSNPIGAITFGAAGKPIPGSPAADFDAKLKQVVNDVVLPNLTILHGLGRVTDREFSALKSSITALSTDQSEGEFKNELKDVTDLINQKVQGTQIQLNAVTHNGIVLPTTTSSSGSTYSGITLPN